MCLTILEASAERHAPGQSKRGAASRRYHVSQEVLKHLTHLSTEKGDPSEVRKAPQCGFDPLTTAEREWMLAVVKALIRRVAEVAFEPDGQPRMLTMRDFPKLR